MALTGASGRAGVDGGHGGKGASFQAQVPVTPRADPGIDNDFFANAQGIWRLRHGDGQPT